MQRLSWWLRASTRDPGAHQFESSRVSANGLVEISEFTGTGDADIEDLFEPEFYLNLVNQAYVAVLPKPITPAA